MHLNKRRAVCVEGTMCSYDYLLHKTSGQMNLTMTQLSFHGANVLEHHLVVAINAFF